MTHLLTEDEYLALFASPMESRDEDDEPPFDFWPYFDAIPSAHFQSYDCSAEAVSHALRHADGCYEHVLIDSDDPNVFMVLVLDTHRELVVGHHLLDLLAGSRRAKVEAGPAHGPSATALPISARL
jgi:hypothetical protein